eukprot:GSMAST32.ASY1.ANO1.1395.1 assembled CDS
MQPTVGLARYIAGVRYAGSNYHGWESGSYKYRCIRQALSDAIFNFSPVSHELLNIRGSSRTDAGVHALRNVFSFDIYRLDKYGNASKHGPFLDRELRRGINNHLHRGGDTNVALLGVQRVPTDFQIRHRVYKRKYIYQIVSVINADETSCSIFSAKRAWITRNTLSLTQMQAAAKIMVGHRDWSSFRSSGCVAPSPIKTISKVKVELAPVTVEGNISFQVTVEGPSFMYHQVRNMVGVLHAIGSNQMSLDELEKLIDAKDRTLAPPMAPADGLYLADVYVDYEYVDKSYDNKNVDEGFENDLTIEGKGENIRISNLSRKIVKPIVVNSNNESQIVKDDDSSSSLWPGSWRSGRY